MHKPITIKASPQKIPVQSITLDIHQLSKKQIIKHIPTFKPSKVKVISQINRINIQQAFKLSPEIHFAQKYRSTPTSLIKSVETSRNKRKIAINSPDRYKTQIKQQKNVHSLESNADKKDKSSNYKFFPKRSSPRKSKSQFKILYSKMRTDQRQLNLEKWSLGEAQKQFLSLCSASLVQLKGNIVNKNRIKTSQPNKKRKQQVQIDLTPWISQDDDAIF